MLQQKILIASYGTVSYFCSITKLRTVPTIIISSISFHDNRVPYSCIRYGTGTCTGTTKIILSAKKIKSTTCHDYELYRTL